MSDNKYVALEKRIEKLELELKEMHAKCMTVTEYRNADFWGVTELEDDDE